MAVRTRLARLARLAAARRPDPQAVARAESARLRAVFLAMIPAAYRARVADALGDPADRRHEPLWSFALAPFARWAGPPPGGYEVPAALVGWMLDPPRDYWVGHNCGRCGLAVPVLTTWHNDPDPPPSVVAFPACPGCCGRTSFSAAYGPEPAP